MNVDLLASGQKGMLGAKCDILLKLRLTGRRAPKTRGKMKEMTNGASKMLREDVSSLQIMHMVTDKEGERTAHMRWAVDVNSVK